MQLKNLRLQMLYNMVPECTTFADIGTDHALLPIHLILNGKCNRAIASDVKDGPLRVAQKNIIKHGLEHKIDVRKGSGLETIEKGECDTVVIAGMGGHLITEIISDSIDTARSISNLILQPNTEEDKVRKYLCENGFRITDENAIQDGNHVYLAIVCTYSPDNIDNYSHIEYCTGKMLYSKKSQGSYDYYSNIRAKSEKIIRLIAKSQSEESKQKVVEQHKILRWIEEHVEGK